MTLSDSASADANPDKNTRRVRTRFAPSPTGMLHLGAMRTALFSWLWARHNNGDFILRIEDTDQNRLVSGALESIIESFALLGLDIDEGPDAASVANLDATKYGPVRTDLLLKGGSYGPYFQSQRLPRYHEVIRRLLDEGKAYYAFETAEELEAMRAAAQMRNEPFKYNRRYRDYPLVEAQARVNDGVAHVVRFKMPVQGPIRTVDYLRGETIWDATTQDDFIILKADGFPPYHLAAMVDDYDMEISHAFRSEEWLPSSPKHFSLFQALGWEPPVFVHTPNVLAPGGGKKLSKRHGAKSVREFLEEGYLVEAMVNFLALVGWAPGGDLELMDRATIIEKFSLKGISTSPGIFDGEKLTWMNGVYIRQMSKEALADGALPFLVNAGLVPADPDPVTRAYISDVLALEQERIKLLSEAPGVSDFFFKDLPEYEEKGVAKHLKKAGAVEYLSDVAAAYADLTDWSVAEIDRVTREVGAKYGREKGDVTHPVRVAVSGREIGPGLFEMIEVLGKERTLKRLARAVEIARG